MGPLGGKGDLITDSRCAPQHLLSGESCMFVVKRCQVKRSAPESTAYVRLQGVEKTRDPLYVWRLLPVFSAN